MAHKRKGQLTVSDSWNKHFDKFLKRVFWKKERGEEKRLVRKLSEEVKQKRKTK